MPQHNRSKPKLNILHLRTNFQMSAPTEQDKLFMKRCIELSQEAVDKGDQPFGTVITKEDKIIAEASNDRQNRINHHAEILAMNKATDFLGTTDLSECTLYTNCEPCPMCSFMMREYKIKKVVFAVPSPYMGGYSRWKILQDKVLGKFPKWFSASTEVVPNVLEDEARKVYDNTPLGPVFGTKGKKKRPFWHI
jgi:tRNA(adenine34) deaminase